MDAGRLKRDILFPNGERACMADRIRCLMIVRGHLPEQWSGWFGDLAIQNLPGGGLRLSGTLPDQAAFFGILAHIRDLGFRVVRLDCIEEGYDPPI
jgi:hypothetical protein